MGQVRKIHDARISMKDTDLDNTIQKDDNTFIIFSFRNVLSTEHDCKWKGNKFPTTAESPFYCGTIAGKPPCGQLDANAENMFFWDALIRQ